MGLYTDLKREKEKEEKLISGVEAGKPLVTAPDQEPAEVSRPAPSRPVAVGPAAAPASAPAPPSSPSPPSPSPPRRRRPRPPSPRVPAPPWADVDGPPCTVAAAESDAAPWRPRVDVALVCGLGLGSSGDGGAAEEDRWSYRRIVRARRARVAAAAAAVAAAAPPPSAAAAAAAAEAAEKCKWGPGGKLGALRTGDEEEVQVAEFMAVLRMRTVDVTSAQARTEALARRMWNGKACGPRSGNLQALRRLRVIGGLCGWYFRSLSFSLAEDAQVPPEVPETLAKRGRRFGAAAKHLRYQSETLHTKALVEAGKPRTWATSGMRTPQDRALEAALRARIAQTHAKAASLLRQAEAYEEEAEGYAGRAQALRPALPTCLSAHMYYHKRLGLARTQRKMEQEFGRDFFTATLNSVASGSSKATLSKMQLAKLVDAMELTPDPGLGVPGVGSVAPRLTGAFAPSGLW